MKENIKGYISIGLGFLFCICVIIAYYPEPQYLVELTCISNFTTGILLIVSGIRYVRNKKAFPTLPFHMALVILALVCIVSCVGHFNFKGAFFFLHMVDPIAILIFFLACVDTSKEKKKIFFTPIPFLIYLAFDYILGMIRGKFVYGILEKSDVNLGVILLVIPGMYLLVLLVAFLTRYVNEKLKIGRK